MPYSRLRLPGQKWTPKFRWYDLLLRACKLWQIPHARGYLKIRIETCQERSENSLRMVSFWVFFHARSSRRSRLSEKIFRTITHLRVNFQHFIQPYAFVREVKFCHSLGQEKGPHLTVVSVSPQVSRRYFSDFSESFQGSPDHFGAVLEVKSRATQLSLVILVHLHDMGPCRHVDRACTVTLFAAIVTHWALRFVHAPLKGIHQELRRKCDMHKIRTTMSASKSVAYSLSLWCIVRGPKKLCWPMYTRHYADNRGK